MVKPAIKAFAIPGVLLLSVSFSMSSFGAPIEKFLHAASIYSDDRGIGLRQPEGVACNDGPFLVVADTRNGRLLRFTFRDGKLGTEAVVIKLPQLPYPSRTGMNSKNEIYVLDGSQRRIVRLTPEGRFKDYLEPVGLPQPVSYVPRSFHIDMNDNIYILDIFSERVLVLDPDGHYRRSIKFPENYGFLSDVTVDFRGNVLLVDSVNAVVFTAGKGSPRFAALTESLKEYVRFPASLASDNRGRLYLLDHNGGSIIVLGQDGSFLGRQLGFGWKEGLLNEPSQLCMNNEGEMFIADTNNDRVQIFATAD